jgi:hypothetical protein
MQIMFNVHRKSAHMTPRTVTINGEDAQADVSVLEVELTPVAGAYHGTLTLRLFSKAEREAWDGVSDGDTVPVTFTLPAPAPAEPEPAAAA